MRRISIVFLIILLCILAYAFMHITPNGHTIEILNNLLGGQNLPFSREEKFEYDVKYKGLDIGESTLVFHGLKELGNKKVYYVTFSTNIPSIRDFEELYGDKDTFLPVEVHRTIKKRIGFNDRIKEIYDQKKFRVDITQKSNLRTKEFAIEKDSPIHNAILLIYYYRTRKAFKENERFKVTLPTVDIEVIYSGKETIKTALGEQTAHTFTSDPPKFKLWLTADEKRIPLKIEDPRMLGYSLVIKSAE